MLATLVVAATIGYAHPQQLLDTAWVAAHADDTQVRVVDVRRSGFEHGHIDGAVWLDPESIRDTSNAPSFMLAPRAFEQAIGRLGISNRTRVVPVTATDAANSVQHGGAVADVAPGNQPAPCIFEW